MTTRDFTGGLNLNTNIMQLAPNESPDMMNVDVSNGGGFRQRKAVVGYDYSFAGYGDIHAYYGSGGNQIIANDEIIAFTGTAINVYSTPGGSVIDTFTNYRNHLYPLRSVQFKDKLYLQNGINAPLRWDGSTDTALTQTYNGDLTAPNDGDMPIGKCMAVYKGCVFVANTLESGTNYRSRIRWSHPNQPEDYVETHWIDVDVGTDADGITALVPFDDRLLIFKRNSVHVLFGDPPENLSVYPLSHDVGTVSQETVASSPMGVYFFDPNEGVYLYNGRSIEWKFASLYPALQDGRIPRSASDLVALGWVDRRLWVGVPWTEDASLDRPTRTFILDPAVGKNGAWTHYDFGVRALLEWAPSDTEPVWLARVGQYIPIAEGYTNHMSLLNQNQSHDHDGSPGAPLERRIKGWYTTPWFDLGEPAVKKRWRRPEVVLIDGQDSQVLCKVYKDYDPTDVKRTMRFITDANSAGTTTGVWDDVGDEWDVNTWAAESGTRGERWVNDKGTPIGSARAVALRFENPPQEVDWGINSLTLKVTPRTVRS